LPPVLVASLLLAVACGAGGHHPALAHQGMCAGTTPGSQVVVYSTTGLEYWYSDTFSTFQQECGVAISYFGAASSDVLARLRLEKPAPLADIAIALPPAISTAADEGLLAGAPGAAAVPANRCGPGRRWCAVAEDYTAWVYNPAIVTPAPTRWSDLTAPRFHGALATVGPSEPIGLAHLVELEHAMGTDGAFAYLRAIEANTVAHYRLTDSMSRVVAAGGAQVANGDLQEDLNDIVQYRDVSIWFPATASGSATTVEIPYGAALVRGGRNPGNARALLAYLWSAGGQALAGDSYAAPAIPTVVPGDTRSAQVRAELAGVTVLTPDWESVTREQAGDVNRWNALRSAPDGVSVPTTLPPVP
jgi:2-aminoethylphosphonate transport system substrate-binding protein